MTLIKAALARCRRDAQGRLKLGDLWRMPAVGHNNLSHAIQRAGLAAQVVTVRCGRNESRGIFAPEEVARQLAELIPPEQLWTEAVPCAPEPRRQNVSREVFESGVEEPASAEDLGSQLSTLLGHPVAFQLRATPDNRPALIDITMIFTGLKRDQAGLVVRRLLEEHPEVRSSISNFKFPGPGQRPTSVAPMSVALEYAFLLPGKAAAHMRRPEAAKIIVRYLGGNVALVDDVITKRSQATLGASTAQNVSREVSDGETDESADAADLGRQLSTLLGHPVNFQLRATPNNWPALIDITMIFTGLKNNQAGLAVRHLLAQYPEFQSSILKFKFPGRGRQTIDVVPLPVALDFAFLLPGKAAAQMRRPEAARIIVRYLGGNVALVDEVITNRSQATLGASAAQNVSREVSDGETDESADAADLGRQLSMLLGHPVNFQLRATPDKWPALVDITMIFTGLNVNHAGEAVRHLLTQYPELHESIVKFKFPGRGQRPISVAPMVVALQYAFLLPGKAAAQMRRQAATLVVRYLGGDVNLVDEVYSNRRAQESLAAVPAEQRTPLQQVVRMCGEVVEAGSTATPLSRPPEPDVLRIHAPPIIMEPCPTGCLDGGPPHFYILGIPGQTTGTEGEIGTVYRGGRTKDFDARLAEHRKTYGNGAHMELCAPKYGHVETLWHRQIRPYAVSSEPREERILASKMELSRVPDFIVELHKIRQSDLQLENISHTVPKKRTREEAEDDLAIAEIDAKRERLAFEIDAQRERLAFETNIYRQREQFILQMAKDGHVDAIRSLLAPRLPL